MHDCAVWLCASQTRTPTHRSANTVECNAEWRSVRRQHQAVKREGTQTAHSVWCAKGWGDGKKKEENMSWIKKREFSCNASEHRPHVPFVPAARIHFLCIQGCCNFGAAAFSFSCSCLNLRFSDDVLEWCLMPGDSCVTHATYCVNYLRMWASEPSPKADLVHYWRFFSS